MGVRMNIIGQKFGRLTVLSSVGLNGRNRTVFRCLCDCGNEKEIIGQNLRSGNTSSCGCEHREQLGDRSRTHGMSRTRLYNIWCSMKQRCFDKNDKNYHNYGGRGIRISRRWMKFENFLADMGESYEKHLSEFGARDTTIERENNDGDYSKENCCWATLARQARNKRTSRLLTHAGETMNLTDWAKRMGCNSALIIKRLKRGWSIKQALTL